MLTPEQKRRYLDDGYLMLEGYKSGTEIAVLRTRIRDRRGLRFMPSTTSILLIAYITLVVQRVSMLCWAVGLGLALFKPEVGGSR